MPEEKKIIPVEKRPRELQRLDSPFEEIEHMFDEFFNKRFLMPPWFPRMRRQEFADVTTSVDMYEEGDDLVIKAELPGMKKEDLSIDLTNDVITISGEKKAEERSERTGFFRVERSFGSFSRRLTLPVEIKADQVTASFSEGVLEIRMPKSDDVRQNVRRITVS